MFHLTFPGREEQNRFDRIEYCYKISGHWSSLGCVNSLLAKCVSVECHGGLVASSDVMPEFSTIKVL